MAQNATQTDKNNKDRIGERLVEIGLITKDQLNVALQEKKKSDKLLGQIFVELGFLSGEMVSNVLAEKSGLQLYDPNATVVDSALLKQIPKSDAQKFQIIPVSYDEDNNALTLAMSDPYDVVALDAMRAKFKQATIKPLVTSPVILSNAIDRVYGYASSINDILRELEEGGEQGDLMGLAEDQAYAHPIVRLVNAFILDAIKAGVSDLHFEPEEHFIRLRYRLDGEMFAAHTLHRQHWSGIAQRLKILAGVNITDKLTPQDGRFTVNVGGREVDFRVSTLPTVYGENIVLRVLDKSTGVMELEELGFSKHNMAVIEKCVKKPEGMIILTGPTGSGKTTSLYAMLSRINTVEKNIQTLEDPVEYALPMVRQTNVKDGILEFADGIRSILRQDPDVILIGEIRDSITAEMALKAAMTGHQVYTTLHTNDCFGVVPRLTDLDIIPGMLPGNIIASFAQRLVRKLCSCKEEYSASAEDAALLGCKEGTSLYRAKGCEKCRDTGYKGRVAAAEILEFDEEIDEMVAAGATRLELKRAAKEKGFVSLRQDVIEKILAGVTSLDAAQKVVVLDRAGAS